MLFRASRLAGLMSWSKLWIPDTIELTERGITVVKKKFFGLSNSQEDVKWGNISSTRVANGIILSTLIIETTGGATADIYIKGMRKKMAREAMSYIQNMCDC